MSLNIPYLHPFSFNLFKNRLNYITVKHNRQRSIDCRDVQKPLYESIHLARITN